MRIKINVNTEAIERITGERLRQLEIHRPIREVDEIGFYDKEFLEYLEENDELSAQEGGFMLGYLDG
jgi:hypothetical protein